jgi:lipopolysaccharide cholinephosphotransferase
MNNQNIKDVQNKILEIMLYIDELCRENGIVYYIMGGTALGAVRHNGFIPWDDDLDIFMTPDNYEKFKKVLYSKKSNQFIIQEWKVVDNYLEYAKVRMNGTTFIENVYKNRKDMHHGIYVDIMILHKCPNSILKQKIIYFASKYVTLFALSQRNWTPKTRIQYLALKFLKVLPNHFLSQFSYKLIYHYGSSNKNYKYCYYLTPAKFDQGLFDSEIFNEPVDINFNGKMLMGPTKINKYLKIRYGDYMELPSIEQQKESIHAEIYDTEVGYQHYL